MAWTRYEFINSFSSKNIRRGLGLMENWAFNGKQIIKAIWA